MIGKLRAFTLGALLLATGCVSRTSGIDSARAEVKTRSGMALPWSGEGNPDDKLVRDILAKPLTADGAARVALWNNADVQAALDDVGIARAAVVAALALPNPRAGLAVHLHSDGDTDLDMDLTIDIVDLFLLPAREAPASAGLEASALEAAGFALDIAFEARVAFYEHQAAAQKLELRKTVLFAAAQSSDIAQRLVDAGNVPVLEGLAERALYEEARVGVAQAEVDAVTARERLNAAMGLFGERGTKWTSAERLAEPTSFDDTKLESRAVAANLDLRSLEKRYTAASGRADLAWAEGLIPDIEAGVGAERDDGEWGFGPVIGVSLPLFYQGQGRVDAAEAEARAAKHRHEAVATRVRATARSATTRLRTAKDNAAFYKNNLLPLREKLVDETLLQYNAMNTGPLQLLTAKRDQIDTAAVYVDVLREYWTARAEAEALLMGRAPSVSRARSAAVPSSRRSGDAH
ncbi:MAG: TolC family protein [Polyangiaceae bacterium]|nr:TolC family protein [Polyangiaceae bacterium]